MTREALLAASVQPGGRAAAPRPLELVQAFVNTVDAEHGPDLFDTTGGLHEWLGRRGLGTGRVRERDLAVARGLREALRARLLVQAAPLPPADHGPLVDALGARVDARRLDEAACTLDAAAERAGLTPRFASGRLEPRVGGVDGALGVVLAAAFAAIADGSWRRLKACPGHRCGWAFYDRSPSASATWCSMRVCGGRAKARAYYARRGRAG